MNHYPRPVTLRHICTWKLEVHGQYMDKVSEMPREDEGGDVRVPTENWQPAATVARWLVNATGSS